MRRLNQVLAAVAASPWRKIFVWSPDIYVLVLLLHLASSGRLDIVTHLEFLTGREDKFRTIDVLERVLALGPIKCRGLIGLHNFTGAARGGKFVGISKKTWTDAYI